MSTGDLKNNVKQLQTELKAIKFTQTLDIDGVVSGAPQTYLSIYHFLFTSYNSELNKDISNSNNELYSKSDRRFMDAVYKILRDLFQYKPQITREQFFTTSFAERKAIMAKEIVRLVYKKYEPMKSMSAFKVSPSREEGTVHKKHKVHQEPLDRPRKIASKSSSSVADTILHPPYAIESGFRIPKSAIPNARANVYDPALAAAASAPVRERAKPVAVALHNDYNDHDEGPYYFHQPLASHLSVSQNAKMKSEVHKQMTDILTPALVTMNERLGKMEITIKTIHDWVASSLPHEPPPTPTPSATTLSAGLAKQMSKVMFHLETFNSRVLLVENRLAMVEAKLDDEASFRKTLANNGMYTGTENGTRCSVVTVTPAQRPSKNTDQQQAIQNIDSDFVHATEWEECQYSAVPPAHGAEVGDGDSAGGSDVEVVVVRENWELHNEKESNLAFIKSLVSPDESVTIVAADSTQDSSGLELKPSKPLISKSPSDLSITAGREEALPHSTNKALCGEFDHLISPIRHFQDSFGLTLPHTQDESVLSIPCGRFDSMADSEGRRSSTPTQLNLDTSTLDRVHRIRQMMQATNQLLN